MLIFLQGAQLRVLPDKIQVVQLMAERERLADLREIPNSPTLPAEQKLPDRLESRIILQLTARLLPGAAQVLQEIQAVVVALQVVVVPLVQADLAEVEDNFSKRLR